MSSLSFAGNQAAPDLFHLLVDHALDLIVAYTPDGEAVYVSPSVEDVLGYGRDEFHGMDHLDLVHADDRQTVRKSYHEPAATGRRVFTRPYRMRKKGGSFAYLETLVQPALGADGGVLLLVASSRDVTDRMEMEKKLRATLRELRFEKTALDAHAIVSIADTGGCITYVNDKFCDIAQYRRQELVGKRHSILNSGYHPKAFFAGMLGTIAQGCIWQGEIRNRRKDGSFFWVNSTIVPFLDSRGAPYQYISVWTDVTHLKVAKEVMERSCEQLERLVAERSRELNRAIEVDMLERAWGEKLRERHSEVRALKPGQT